MTTQDISTQVRSLSQQAREANQPREAELLDLVAQGLDAHHAEILATTLRSLRDAYLAGQRDCAKHSGCYQ